MFSILQQYTKHLPVLLKNIVFFFFCSSIMAIKAQTRITTCFTFHVNCRVLLLERKVINSLYSLYFKSATEEKKTSMTLQYKVADFNISLTQSLINNYVFCVAVTRAEVSCISREFEAFSRDLLAIF